MAISGLSQALTTKDFIVYAGFCVLSYAVIHVYRIWATFKRCNLPMAGVEKGGFFAARKRYSQNAWDFLREAYAKYGDDVPFLIPALDKPRAILPARYMDEIKNLPNNISDRDAAVYEESLGSYVGFTHMDTVTDTHFKVVKGQLGAKLGDVFRRVKDEFEFAFKMELPGFGETATLPVMERILCLNGRVDARVFVGEPLCRDDDWIKSSIEFTELTFRASLELLYFGPILRPLFWWVSPSWRALRKAKKRNLQTVGKEIERRLALERKAKEAGIPWADKPEDMLQWLWDAAEPKIKNKRDMADLMTVLNIAAIHTSSMFITHALYDLLSNPEYIEPLREEIKSVIEDEGGVTKRGLDKMKKLDSFLKESQRMNSLGAILVSRLMREDVRLSNGFVLPAGTITNSAQQLIHDDEKFYTNPKKFDGYRFLKMQEDGQGLEKNGMPTRLTSTAGCSLAFGIGRRVCSGRFLAGIKAKLIFIELLRSFELSLEKPELGRPANLYIPTGNCVPDPFAKFVFRKLPENERHF